MRNCEEDENRRGEREGSLTIYRLGKQGAFESGTEPQRALPLNEMKRLTLRRKYVKREKEIRIKERRRRKNS